MTQQNKPKRLNHATAQAIEWLERLGNKKPTKKQILWMELLLMTITEINLK